MGRNNKSLNHQLHQRMESLKAFGESRHLAKQEYKEYCQINNKEWNPTKTVGIHSENTYKAYKQTSSEFSTWLKGKHPNIKNISDITKIHCIEYLQSRQADCKSAWTYSKDMSALNKLLNFDVTKKEAGLGERSYKNVTRSRESRTHDSKVNLDNYKDQVSFAKSSGCRRESVLKVTPNHFVRDSSGTVTGVHLKEKGGRARIAPILLEYREEITNLVDSCTNNPDKPLFDKYSNKIDNHAFRAEYAEERYKELIDNKGYEDINYRGHDKELILQVSEDLGHSRASVVVEHYLRNK